jgi:hypothetical protein
MASAALSRRVGRSSPTRRRHPAFRSSGYPTATHAGVGRLSWLRVSGRTRNQRGGAWREPRAVSTPGGSKETGCSDSLL